MPLQCFSEMRSHHHGSHPCLVVDWYFITHGITRTAHTQSAFLAQPKLAPLYTVDECNVVFDLNTVL